MPNLPDSEVKTLRQPIREITASDGAYPTHSHTGTLENLLHIIKVMVSSVRTFHSYIMCFSEFGVYFDFMPPLKEKVIFFLSGFDFILPNHDLLWSFSMLMICLPETC